MVLFLWIGAVAHAADRPVELVLDAYTPDWLDNATTICVNRFIEREKNVVVKPFSNLKLPGAAGLCGELQ